VDILTRLGYTVQTSTAPLKSEIKAQTPGTSKEKEPRNPEAGRKVTSSLIDSVISKFGPYDGQTDDLCKAVVEEVLELCGQATGTKKSAERLAKFLVYFFYRPGREINGQFVDKTLLRELYR